MLNYRLLSVFSRVVVLSVSLVVFNASSVVNIDKTRVVFSPEDNIQSVNLLNNGDGPTIVQVWTDNGNLNVSPDESRTPVIAVPPVMKIFPGEMRSLRLMLINRSILPEDRESLFWLNAYQIPSLNSSVSNVSEKVLLPLRLRLKVLIRPPGVAAPKSDDILKIKFFSEGKDLVIVNPTPWYMSLNVTLRSNEVIKDVFLSPRAQLTVSPEKQVNPGDRLDFSVLDDNGVPVNYVAKVIPFF